MKATSAQADGINLHGNIKGALVHDVYIENTGNSVHSLCSPPFAMLAGFLGDKSWTATVYLPMGMHQCDFLISYRASCSDKKTKKLRSARGTLCTTLNS